MYEEISERLPHGGADTRPVASGLRFTRRSPAYRLSGLILGLYVLTVVVMSKSPERAPISRALGFVLAAIFGLELISSGRNRFMLPAEFWTLWMFLASLLGGSLWAPHRSAALTLSFTGLQLFVLAVVTFNILVARRSVLLVAVPYVAGAAGAVGWAFIERSQGITWGGLQRTASLLEDPNNYAEALLIASMLCWYLCHKACKRHQKILLVALGLLFSHEIVFATGSRKGVIVLLAIPIMYVLFGMLTNLGSLTKELVLQGMVAGIVLVSLVLTVSQSPMMARLEKFARDVDLTQVGYRGHLLKTALEAWLEKPLLGHGTGQFLHLYLRLTGLRAISHNNYAELLANNGLFGLLIYYSRFGILIIRYWRLFQKRMISRFQIRWAYVFLGLLLLMDMGYVSYQDKFAWLSFMVLMAVPYVDRLDLFRAARPTSPLPE